MSHPLRIRFIVNPTSGPRRREDVAALIKLHIDQSKYNHEIVYTAHAGHATDLAKEAVEKGYNVVVAVGGDGTVNEVARGLLYSDTALAILPKGSGNGLARHLLVPLNLKGALQVINKGNISFIDSGNINGNPFFTTAGIGFDAYISSVFAGNSKRGLRTYVELVLKEVMKYRHLPIKATINGSDFDSDCYVMAFANAAQYGNNAYIAPMADIQDGLLDVCLVRQLDFRKALHLSYCMLTKQLATDSAEYFQTNAVEVETEQEIMYHADGDFMGKATKFSVHMEPKSLKVVMPG